MTIGKGKKGLLTKTSMNGSLSLVNEVKLLQSGRRIAWLTLSRSSKDSQKGWFSNLVLTPWFWSNSRSTLPRVGAEDLVITITEIAGVFVFRHHATFMC